jgi:hypothetical protein
MFAHLPQREALYEVHGAVDRHEALVAFGAVVPGQLFDCVGTVGGA